MMPIRLSRAVKWLLISNVVIFVIEKTVDMYLGGELWSVFALVPSKFAFQFHFWQILTYGFIHADPFHLFFNLLMLAFIAPELERVWGSSRFLKYYLFCIGFSGFIYLLVQIFYTGGLVTPLMGASGGVFGILMAFGILFGDRTMLLMMMFPMKVKHMVWVLAGLEFMTLAFSGNQSSGLSAVAHLSGMAGGFFYLWGEVWWRRMKRDREQGRAARKRSGSHLKLVVNRPGEGPDRQDDDQGGSDKGPTWH